jgi:hypothetical protein
MKLGLPGARVLLIDRPLSILATPDYPNWNSPCGHLTLFSET